jgi:NAD(P)-dependent dehydrogenase (short-subunit alcohol dehydrogenase family)
MNGQMTGRVAIVTGAASGIGRATALAFAARGASVVVSDVMVDGGEETVKLIRDQGGTASFVRADVSRDADVKALVERTVRDYGRLDYAFNNAGIEGENGSTAECSEENFDRVIAINLKGVWLGMKYEIPAMLANGGGAIVNCSSVAGLVGFPNLPAYVASKHGVVGLTKAAALDYATSGIRVNAVCPGVIATPMVERVTAGSAEAEAAYAAFQPLGRMGTSEEIAESVVWLCSDASAFVTGHAMAVDGGLVAR